MKMKQIITFLLLIFVIGSVAYMFGRQAGADKQTAPTIAIEKQPIEATVAESRPVGPSQIVVYYFHGDQRCMTCQKLEGYAKEALDANFADQLASGQIVWKPINIDQPANTHFVKDYGLFTKSVILSRLEDGRETAFKNLDRIWNLVSDKDRYIEYIREQIAAFLESDPS